MHGGIAAGVKNEKLAGLVSKWDLSDAEEVSEWADVTNRIVDPIGADARTEEELPRAIEAEPVKGAMFIED